MILLWLYFQYLHESKLTPNFWKWWEEMKQIFTMDGFYVQNPY